MLARSFGRNAALEYNLCYYSNFWASEVQTILQLFGVPNIVILDKDGTLLRTSTTPSLDRDIKAILE